MFQVIYLSKTLSKKTWVDLYSNYGYEELYSKHPEKRHLGQHRITIFYFSVSSIYSGQPVFMFDLFSSKYSNCTFS